MVQTCSKCGFSGSDIGAEVGATAREVVASTGYQMQRRSNDFPALANAFLCAALIAEREGDYASAGWSTVHAAWACDDADAPASGRARRLAIGRFRRATESDLGFAADRASEHAILVDLLRRSRQYDEAAAEVAAGRTATGDGVVVDDVLRFGGFLVGSDDSLAHTVGEATEWASATNVKAGEN